MLYLLRCHKPDPVFAAFASWRLGSVHCWFRVGLQLGAVAWFGVGLVGLGLIWSCTCVHSTGLKDPFVLHLVADSASACTLTDVTEDICIKGAQQAWGQHCDVSDYQFSRSQ